MRSPNHYYYTGGSSHFKVFRLGIRLAIFVVAPLVLLTLGRTEGLFPCLKTPNKRKSVLFRERIFVWLPLPYLNQRQELLRCPKVASCLERRQLSTAVPTRPSFFVHRTRSGALKITAAYIVFLNFLGKHNM